MVTAAGNPARMQRAIVWMLCQLLPAEFRPRQRAEWVGDLIALSAGGSAACWRYLFAAAWTLPSLRAHARRAGLDRPQAIVGGATIPVKTFVQVIIAGLGVPVVSWLISVPLRWYLLDVPGRLAASWAFDPKDLWPSEGLWGALSPLWIALHLGALTVVKGSFLVSWFGVSAAVLGPLQRGANGRQRFITALLGVTVIAFGPMLWHGGVAMSGMSHSPYYSVDKGLMAAVFGAIGVIFGWKARGLTWRSRLSVVAFGIAAIAIFAFHHAMLGEQMLNWLLD